MQWTDYDSQTCSIARTVDVLGDRWTTLILRDLFNGVHRFEDLHRHLNIARDILTKRLRPWSLLACWTRSPTGSLAPALAMSTGSPKPEPICGPFGPPMALRHECGATVRARLTCEHGHQMTTEDQLRIVPQSGAKLAG